MREITEKLFCRLYVFQYSQIGLISAERIINVLLIQGLEDGKMPFITVKLAKGRTVEQKQQFVEAITIEAARILHVQEEWVTVVFDEYERENWASAGQLHSIKFGEGYGNKGAK